MVAHTMTQSILEGVSRRTEHLRSLMDSSNVDLKAPTYFLDVTEGLRTCVLLREYLFETYKLLWKELIENELEECDLTGGMYLMALTMAQRSYRVVREKAEEVKARASVQDISPQFGEALAAFHQAVKEVEDLEQDFKTRWPWFDQGKFQMSVAEERQGSRRRSMKEIHDELRRRVR